MTNGELHDLLDLLLDKSDLPWFNATEKDRFLNLAQMEFVKERYNRFEVDEKAKQDLATLVRSVRINESSRTFMIETLPEFMFFVNMVAYFGDPDRNRSVKDELADHDETIVNTPIGTGNSHNLKPNRKSLTVSTLSTDLTDTIRRSVKPVQLDDLHQAFGDPFNEPTDECPLYLVRADVKGHQFVEIYSTTNPTMIDVDFIKKPVDINGATAPSDSPELIEYTHEEIANIAVRKMIENIESQRYQTQIRETQEQFK